MATTQQQRLISIDVPSLGADVLMLTGLVGHEAISSPFSFDLELISEKPDKVVLNQVVGQPATVAVELNDGSKRFFNGVISRCAQTGRDIGGSARFTHYQAELVPTLWLLSRASNCRIFQDLTVPEILEKLFADHGVEFRKALSQTYTKWDYCVQYRETDFSFASRLMEQEGIFYFFEHQSGKHTLVLADSSQAHKTCPGQAQARFEPEGGIGEREDTVSDWQERQEVRSGKYTLRDHHFEMPPKTLEVSSPSTVNVPASKKLEIYDYHGEYAERFNKPDQRLGDVEPEGRKLVKLRMQEEEVPHLVITGSSICRPFAAGTKFNLTSPPPGVTPGPYVLTSVQHSAVQGPGFVSGDDGDATYSNSFTCIPLATPYRPRRLTPKPIVQGPQTAVVVGRSGEEINCDKYGRVKVQFFWDRQGSKNENSSCFVRVATPWAGKQWGMVHIPRIGHEVIVSFLEGDPDQPIIIGSVYNAENMPPYPLPDENTRSGIKSRSSKGGGPDNANEFRFEDKKGQEEVLLHAERQLTTEVEADESRTVGGSRKTTIGKDDELTIKNDYKIKVTNNWESEAMMRKTTIKATDELTAGMITINCGASKVEITPASVTITAPIIKLSAPMVQADGVIQCSSLIASIGVISPLYTPGVGNIL